jgi:hypothetical protein
MAMLYKETVTRTKGDDWNIDLTITATLKHRDTGAQVWQGTRAGGQITVTSDPNGQISIAVPAATTATLSQRLYNMDVQYVKNSVTVTPKRWFVQVVEDYT